VKSTVVKPKALLPPLLVLIGVVAGCDNTTRTASGPTRLAQPRLDEAAELEQDDLKLGLEFLNQVYEPSRYYVDPRNPGAPPDMDRRALYHLNQWLARETKQADQWKATPLLQFVPKSLAAIQPLQEIERMKLTVDDMHFLHGRIWQRDIARRVTAEALPAPWQQWVEENHDALPPEQLQQLSGALLLFDWTIRNVQLDPFPAPEEATVGTASGDNQEATALPPQRGVPGPGYQRYPYETLLYGHGDAYERARVFMELCRQENTDTALLAVASDNGPARPWAVAVLIGEHLYLFDAELGLPIPSHGARGVATLAALASEPKLLEQMDVSDKQTYWVKPAALGSLHPLLSAAPEELSKRMWLLDRSTSGSKHLAVFVDVDAIAAQLQQSPQLKGAKVSLWRVPFEASLYVSLGLGLRLSRDPEFATEYGNQIYFAFTPIRQARQQQLRGTFDTSEEIRSRRLQRERHQRESLTPEELREVKKRRAPTPLDGGAVELYLSMRPDGQAIDDLADSEYWQTFFGQPLPQDEQQRRQMLEMWGTRIQRFRDDISYWLGLIQYDKGSYENAITWLKRCMPENSPEAPWADGARYNLARCYEALGQTQEAVKLYRSDDSPQKYGNQLRAKWLGRAAKEPAAER
jgi:hypothetical protein